MRCWGRSHRGLSAGCHRSDVAPSWTPLGAGSQGLEAKTSAVRFFRSLQSGPCAKPPRATDLGLRPVPGASAGSGRFSKGFHFKAAPAGACTGPGRSEAGQRDRARPPAVSSPGRFPGWPPLPRAPCTTLVTSRLARSDQALLASPLVRRDGRRARAAASGGVGEVLPPRGVALGGPLLLLGLSARRPECAGRTRAPHAWAADTPASAPAQGGPVSETSVFLSVLSVCPRDRRGAGERHAGTKVAVSSRRFTRGSKGGPAPHAPQPAHPTGPQAGGSAWRFVKEPPRGCFPSERAGGPRCAPVSPHPRPCGPGRSSGRGRGGVRAGSQEAAKAPGRLPICFGC